MARDKDENESGITGKRKKTWRELDATRGKSKAHKEAMLNLRELPDRQAWVAGVINFLEKFPELPEDPYFLDSLLDHPREEIVDKSLDKLESLCEQGKL